MDYFFNDPQIPEGSTSFDTKGCVSERTWRSGLEPGPVAHGRAWGRAPGARWLRGGTVPEGRVQHWPRRPGGVARGRWGPGASWLRGSRRGAAAGTRGRAVPGRRRPG
eukprot:120410-Alexandrium_andersonii.AAC.1